MSIVENQSATAIAAIFGRAEVLQLEAESNRARVRLLDRWEFSESWAQLAIGNTPLPQLGDRVLVAGDYPNDVYVIGCLSLPSPRRLQSSGGIYAELGKCDSGNDTVRVMTSDDQLLFEVNSVTGAAKLALPAGNLEIAAGKGDLVLRAAGAIRLEGQTVELRARHKLAMVVSNQLATVASWFRMLPERLQLGSDQVSLSARDADFNVSSAAVTGEKLKVQADRFHGKVRVAETVAETIIERAGNAYRTVRELSQLQAGRFRTFVSGLSHFRSKRAYFSSEEAFHIDGDQVNLG